MDFTPYIGDRRYERVKELADGLQQRLFIGTDTGPSYRVLNHWENVGLIDNSREEGQRWRRFTFVEFVWVRMIDEMRKVGLPVEIIKLVKVSLFQPASIVDLDLHLRSIYLSANGGKDEHKEEREAMERDMRGRFDGGHEEQEVDGNWLQHLILSTIVKRCPIVLVVFADGSLFAIHEEPGHFILPEQLDRLSFETHVRIPITGIIKEFLRGGLAIERMGDLQILEPNEQTVLRIIHSGQYDSVTVNFKDKKMKSMELRQSQEVTRKIVDVLAAGKYQDISIVQHEGQITKIENTLKFKFPA
jgi:DNA-binding transcriptional MerR regulator